MNLNENKLSKKAKTVVIQNKELLDTYIKEKNYKFLVDGMLQKLAFNLRNCGIDTAFSEEMTIAEKIKWAESEGRIILTKDRNLIHAKKSCPLIRVIDNKKNRKFY